MVLVVVFITLTESKVEQLVILQILLYLCSFWNPANLGELLFLLYFKYLYIRNVSILSNKELDN